MASPAPARRRLFRRRNGRIVAGVAAGLSEHLGIDVLLLRVGFVITVVLGGLGVFLYAAFWAVVPADNAESRSVVAKASRGQLVGFACLGLVTLVVTQLIGFGPALLWPTAAAVTGAAILWRQADEASRLRWRRLATSGTGGSTVLRLSAGLLLVVVGVVSFLAAHGQLPQARRALLPVLVVVLGVLLVLGPWLLQTLRQVSDERTARIREQERVELAGRVHDSMLQTLTLIQRRSNDPEEVRRLVRHSERELRGWLYSPAEQQPTLRAAVSAVCAEIEDEYAVTIDLVVVGEQPMSPAVEPLVQALREAAINAAKHSGTDQFAVYVEVAATDVVGFVRDRGRGFDLDSVAADRYGVRESVIARMQRHSGTAAIRTTAGNGTEVRLTLPLQSAART
jgi:signal transduction histidine kinase